MLAIAPPPWPPCAPRIPSPPAQQLRPEQHPVVGIRVGQGRPSITAIAGGVAAAGGGGGGAGQRIEFSHVEIGRYPDGMVRERGGEAGLCRSVQKDYVREGKIF